MILASVLVLAVLAVARIRMPVWSGMAIVGLFALAHGFAHGAEIPALANAWIYGAGFVAATSLIHALGAAAALTVTRMKAIRV
jgi:urease accessory protein